MRMTAGRTVAYSDAGSIWTTDTERGSQSRIFTGLDSLTGFPVWSADGAHLYFRTASGILRLRADGEGKPDGIRQSRRSGAAGKPFVGFDMSICERQIGHAAMIRRW